MKAVILCGGFGTRFSEETKSKPKPMILLGKFPILFHILKIYEKYGITNFILALGYKGKIIEKFFNSKNLEKLNFEYCKYLNKKHRKLSWNIEFCYSGLKTMTGGRLLRLKRYLKNEDDFLLTYGDGLANVNIKDLIKFHKKHKKIGTVTAVIPSARFGALDLKGNKVKSFSEKPQSGEGWINGGFFCFKKKIFNYLKNDKTVLEEYPLSKLSEDKNLNAFKHFKFWQCMDTRRDHDLLVKQWKNKKALWLKN
jgi:glucose-1-phosphate cytidylyltransferase